MAEATLGTCSHPNCPWIGLFVNWKKHKDGCGKEANRRAGKHEGCTCCRFVLNIAPTSEAQLSCLQRTLQLLPAFDASSVHEHLRGEFHRRANISQRELAFEQEFKDSDVLDRHKNFCKIRAPSNDIVRQQVKDFFQSSSEKYDSIQTSAQHVLSHIMVDDHGEVHAKTKFRFVADEGNKYKTSIQHLVQYARGVFLERGTVAQILYETFAGNGNIIAGFVLYLIASAKTLDDLQHTLMHLEFAIRAAVLLTVHVDRVILIAQQHLNELKGGAWTYMRHVRRIAISVDKDGEKKDTRIRWPDLSENIR
jgi:hypothetical protein